MPLEPPELLRIGELLGIGGLLEVERAVETGGPLGAAGLSSLEWTLLLPSTALFAWILLRGLVQEGHGPLPTWPPLVVLIALLAHLSLQQLASGIGALFQPRFLPPAWAVGANVLYVDLGTCLLFLFLARGAPRPLDALGLRPPRRPRNALLSVLACLSFLLPLALVTLLWLLFLKALGYEPRYQLPLKLFLQAVREGDWPGIALISLGAAVAAPVMEELLFRGFLLGTIQAWTGAVPAAILSSAAFAALHEAIYIVPIFLVGLTLARLYQRTGTLVYPMIFHAMFNSSTLVHQGLWPGS